jgi:hypothetical protein
MKFTGQRAKLVKYGPNEEMEEERKGTERLKKGQ